MKKLALGLLLATVAVPAAAQDKTLAVWDFKSAEPLMQPYFEKVKELFNAKHPDITLKQVAQPGNNYYVLLGTAINANEGPDVALVHNGADALTRADAFVRLKDEVADIHSDVVGWESFQSPDGTFVAVPISIQGVALYYSKETYKEAGLDPDKPPQTWEELTANCEALTKISVTCFGVGNKDGVGFESAITAMFDGSWSEETRQKFIKHELSWTSPEMKGAWEKIDQLLKAGWIENGANSYNPYTDTVNQLVGGKVGHMFGLVSDAPNSWRNIENLIEAGNLGVTAPVAIGRSATDNPHRLTVDGGIGFGITRWSKQPDVALDYIKATVDAQSAFVFMESAGGLTSNKTVDTAPLNSPAATEVIKLIECCSLPGRMKSYFVPAERQEMVRVGQLLMNGEISVDDALASIERIRLAK
jgi:ABC-type glycerol-3-phosphate transport system substrate-binding protein